MALKPALKTVAWIVAIGSLLFIAAGDWRWPQGWFFLTELGLSSLLVTGWLARDDPDLLRERLSAPVHRDQVGWDRIFLPGALGVFLAWLALIACDGRRFGWSRVPVSAEALGALAIAASMILAWQTFRYNTFAVPQARVQADRGQHVISDGPYPYVRHPMYSAALFFFVGAPLLLGSWLGLFLVPFLAVGLGLRGMGEERLLVRDLPGYDAYMAKVRYRMVPGLC